MTSLEFQCHLIFLKWLQAKVMRVSLKTENEEGSEHQPWPKGGLRPPSQEVVSGEFATGNRLTSFTAPMM
jgi:hypothetical protein